MWHERNREHPNYRRMDYVYAQHHARYQRYVEAHGLTCQECGGMGGDVYTHYSEPGEPCGYCETTGLVTRWMRGQWLNWKRQEKRAKAQGTREKKAQAA